MTTPTADTAAIVSMQTDLLAFERLISGLSATLIGLPAEAIDGHIEQAIGQVAEFMDVDRSTVTQRSPEHNRLRVTHQWVRPGIDRVPTEAPDDLPWLVGEVLRGRTVVLSSMDDLPPEAQKERAFVERHGPRSNVTVPLVVAGELLGVLTFGTLHHERNWPAEIVERLRLVGDAVANALARKEADLALQKVLQFERLVSGLAAHLMDVTPETVDAGIQSALQSIALFLQLDRATILQRSSEDGLFSLTHQWTRDGVPSLDWNEPQDADPWELARLIDRREPLIVSRLDDLPPEAKRERDLCERRGVRSLALVPLASGERAAGVLAFVSTGHELSWPDGLVQRLRLCGAIVAIALARGRADRELRDSLAENEKLRAQLEAENLYLRTEVRGAPEFREIVGQSVAIRGVLHKVDQVAATDTAVLLLGETGTGKELVANAIHARSHRSQHALIAVNCAALPATLVESELFGHEKGAFTGAVSAKPGRFELADRGTLFLDEIGDLEPALQAKLLRALQDGEIQRLGATRPRRVDVRVIAATNRNLDQLLRQERFRTDLYYRLSVFPIELPPLRERREDIPLLVWFFIQSRQRSFGRSIERVPRAAMEALQRYDWPGNVRELQNVIERALILSPGSVLRLQEAFPLPAADPETPPDARVETDTLDEADRAHIARILDGCHWKIEGRGQAAERLGLKPSTLRNRMKKLGIRRPLE